MAKTMTPSGITSKQIGKVSELLGAALRKSGILSEPFQLVLEHQGKELVTEFIAMVHKRVKAVSDMIVRCVRVNRTRTPEQALDATGRSKYVDGNVVANMPHGEGDEATIHFFKLGRYIGDDDLEKEYDLRGLKPADPFSLAAINEADPTFADDYPNCTHWKDANGNWCYSAFIRWGDDRNVGVGRSGRGWLDCWWFAGVRK